MSLMATPHGFDPDPDLLLHAGLDFGRVRYAEPKEDDQDQDEPMDIDEDLYPDTGSVTLYDQAIPAALGQSETYHNMSRRGSFHPSSTIQQSVYEIQTEPRRVLIPPDIRPAPYSIAGWRSKTPSSSSSSCSSATAESRAHPIWLEGRQSPRCETDCGSEGEPSPTTTNLQRVRGQDTEGSLFGRAAATGLPSDKGIFASSPPICCGSPDPSHPRPESHILQTSLHRPPKTTPMRILQTTRPETPRHAPSALTSPLPHPLPRPNSSHHRTFTSSASSARSTLPSVSGLPPKSLPMVLGTNAPRLGLPARPSTNRVQADVASTLGLGSRSGSSQASLGLLSQNARSAGPEQPYEQQRRAFSRSPSDAKSTPEAPALPIPRRTISTMPQGENCGIGRGRGRGRGDFGGLHAESAANSRSPEPNSHHLFMRAMRDVVVQGSAQPVSESPSGRSQINNSETGGSGTYDVQDNPPSASASRSTALASSTPAKPTSAPALPQAQLPPRPGPGPQVRTRSPMRPISMGHSTRSKRADVLERELRDQQAAATRRGMTLLDYLVEKQRQRQRFGPGDLRPGPLPGQLATSPSSASASRSTSTAALPSIPALTGPQPALPAVSSQTMRDQMAAAQRRGMTLEGYLEWKKKFGKDGWGRPKPARGSGKT
ncbi:hypothetical protein IAU59_005819 [Kwoniella sp. CBS 9459]